jgi:hypothetical protein
MRVSTRHAALRNPRPQLTLRSSQPTQRRITKVAAKVDEEEAKVLSQNKGGDELNDRILSGEFTDSGSTKEKLTRPVRKVLAQDPVGIGECQWGQMHAC